jgi:methylglutaconyl-CoA hydratase
MPETITLDITRRVARVTMNRPKVRNAFNGVMLEELHDTFRTLAGDPEVRVVVLTGAGTAFCAGADLNWMRSVRDATFKDNLREARLLADTLYAMEALPQPLVGRISGPSRGGGVGLAAVTDLSVATTDAGFALTEVRVGLVPATIAPFVIRRVGPTFAREMFLTARMLSADDALGAGLVNQVVGQEDLDGAVEELVATLVANAPQAMTLCKDLLRHTERMSPAEAREWTAHMIARRRQSAEGQEGMAAFLEKRPPAWTEGA